jgi:hypothetical protein
MIKLVRPHISTLDIFYISLLNGACNHYILYHILIALQKVEAHFLPPSSLYAMSISKPAILCMMCSAFW